MGKVLYLECNSGISGDMTVGALLDLGADRKVLEEALESLGVDGYHLHFGRKVVSGLDAYDFDVHLESDGHEHEHSHGEELGHTHVHNHGGEPGHGHMHEHSHGEELGHAHTHIHRNLTDIYEIIDRLNSSDHVKTLAKKMFLIVAEAESKAHGLPLDQVHFHEVGAVDSIVDIISVAVLVDNLGVDDIVVSPLSEGHGHVHCQHGILPVPVPATANIVSAYNLKLNLTDNEGEMVTPTGAAIAAALRTKENLPTSCRLLKVGMGAGNRVYKQANVLRALLLETEDSADNSTEMWVMETNIDDCSGEMLGFTMELLLEAGAADVWYTPVYMKKNRPAYMMSIVYNQNDQEKLEDIILTQTTTIGIRRYPVTRTILSREKKTVNTSFGPAEVKICRHKERTYCYPEYESVRQISRDQGLDYQTVYYEIRKTAEENQND